MLVSVLVFDLFIWFVLLHEDRREILTVAFLDVGQGDSVFIESPNGIQLLIDGGSNASVLRALSEVTPFYDRSIDVLLATHADQDHIGGLSDVLSRFAVATVIQGGTTSDTSAYRAFERGTDNERADSRIVHAGDMVILDEGRNIVLDILFPDRDASGFETNTGSIVARLSYGEVCFIFTGDSPIAVERYLIDVYSDSLRCAVLKVGHHGSKTSSSLEFVTVVSPKYSVISAGKDNKYGHPHSEVLDIFNDAHAEVLRTDELGTITFETDGRQLWVK